MRVSSRSGERSIILSENSHYICRGCNAPLSSGTNCCSVCGLMFSQPTPVENTQPTSPQGNFVSAKGINHSSKQASFTAPFIASKTDQSSPALWKRIIRGSWYAFLVFIAIGATGEIISGETSALWVLAMLGLPTLWLHKRLNTQTKTIATGVFALIVLGCVIFSNTPHGKAAHAIFQQQIAHDQRVAAQKQQQQQAEDAKRQAQEAHDKKIAVQQQKAEHGIRQAKESQAEQAKKLRQQNSDRGTTDNQLNADVSSSDNPSGIDLSYGQVTRHLSKYIAMQNSTSVRSQPRSMGMTRDKMALLEVVGEKSNISQATLAIALPKDSQETVTRNGLFVLVFMSNIVPNWKESTTWTTNAIKEATLYPGEPVSTEHDNKKIEFTFEKPIAMLLVTVKHK